MDFDQKIREWKRIAIGSPVESYENIINRFDLYRRQFSGLTDKNILVNMILTFDRGEEAHYWDNNDYNQCWHLSISVVSFRKGNVWRTLFTPQKAPNDEINAWLKLLFGDLHPDIMSVVWHQTGYFKPVQHFRIFVDKSGNPVLPGIEHDEIKLWTSILREGMN